MAAAEHSVADPPNASHTARARARAELTQEIKAVARRQLAQSGAPSISLRSVARELGMVSSAVYRYFPSRDDLLTSLIVDAYDAVGSAGEQALARGRGAVTSRWLRVAEAIRGWALANPHEYALIYGSPVPGYRAPPRDDSANTGGIRLRPPKPRSRSTGCCCAWGSARDTRAGNRCAWT